MDIIAFVFLFFYTIKKFGKIENGILESSLCSELFSGRRVGYKSLSLDCAVVVLLCPSKRDVSNGLECFSLSTVDTAGY